MGRHAGAADLHCPRSPTGVSDADAATDGGVAAHGRRRQTVRGESLFEAGQGIPLFVVVSGELEVVRPSETGDTPIVHHRPGQIAGESNTFAGRPSITRVRVIEPGEVIQLDRDQLLALIQTDAELSEIILGAFLQRRLGLVAGGLGDVVIVGAAHNPGRFTPRSS